MASKAGLTNQEAPKLEQELSRVVDYVTKISEVKGGGEIKSKQRNVGREDQVDSSRILAQEKAVSQAKNHNGLFIVPAIFEEI